MLGIQFTELFRDDLFFSLARQANDMAKKLYHGLEKLGYGFLAQPCTNMLFPILPNKLIDKLSTDYELYVWQKVDASTSAIRLVTSWATKEEAIQTFLASLEPAFTHNSLRHQ